MPKHKKQPNNAYYFFMKDKKKEYERQGNRFPGGMKDIAAMENVRQEWKVLDPSKKAEYEAMAKEAKEADKKNLDNKFTNMGESYAQVQESQKQANKEMEFVNGFLEVATKDTDILDSRNFVILKTLHTFEVFPDSDFWPAELAIAAFSMKDGLRAKWWTLVDTRRTPTGYASAAKDFYDTTCIPEPGSSVFQKDHSNYLKMLRSMKKFILTFVEPFKNYYILFVMQKEEKSAGGCLKWLVENATYESDEEGKEMSEFFKRVKFVRVSQLLLKLASVAKIRNPGYDAQIAMFDYLEDAACRVLSQGDWDFRENITCSFHNQDKESVKMPLCCQNVVLRTVFIILRELAVHMGVAPQHSHRIESIKAPLPYDAQSAPVEVSTSKNEQVKQSDALSSAWDGGFGPSRKIARSDASPVPDFPSLATSSAAAAGFGSATAGSSASKQGNSIGSAWDTPRKQNSTAPPSFSGDNFPSLDSGAATVFGRDNSWSVPGVGRGVGRGVVPVNSGRGQVQMPDYIPLQSQREERAKPPGIGRGRGVGFH